MGIRFLKALWLELIHEGFKLSTNIDQVPSSKFWFKFSNSTFVVGVWIF